MQKRGLHFMKIPDSYYNQLREKLAKSKVKILEDMDEVCVIAYVFYSILLVVL